MKQRPRTPAEIRAHAKADLAEQRKLQNERYKKALDKEAHRIGHALLKAMGSVHLADTQLRELAEHAKERFSGSDAEPTAPLDAEGAATENSRARDGTDAAGTAGVAADNAGVTARVAAA